MLEFLFNKVADLQTCNFIKQRLQHRYFSVKFAKSLRASFLQNACDCCFWKYLMNSLFIAQCEWWIVSLCGTYWLSSAYFILLRVFNFFLFLSLFLFFCKFYYLLRYWGKVANTWNKALELFLDSSVEFRRVSCFSRTWYS